MESYDALLVNAGTGNLHSVYNALKHLGYNVKITDQPEDLLTRCRVILPGVGAFGSFMEGLRTLNLENALKEVARRGDPLLGICVGMQAMLDVGKELGEHQGLGLISGQVIRFPEFQDLKVPHTGWNQLVQQRESQLFANLQDGAYAYFNHSYYCELKNQSDALTLTDYGLSFASAIERGNLFGVQFHPEKSQRVGQTILENFFKV